MSATLELFPCLVKEPRKPTRAVPPAPQGDRGNALAAAAAFARTIDIPPPPPAPTIPRAANYISAKTTGEGPVLSGRYEVLIPYRDGRIIFCDTLAAVAEVVASARWSDPAKYDAVLAELEGVKNNRYLQNLGMLAAGGRGIFIHAPYDNGTPWMAKVRGTQHRAKPKYGVGEQVLLADTSLPHLVERQVEVTNIKLTDHPGAGMAYLYIVKKGSTSTYQVREKELLPLAEVTGSLDFGQLTA